MWFLKADRDGRLFYVCNKNSELFIGRGREMCALVLLGDTSISRRHAVLRLEDQRLTLQDLGSTYKTFLNDNITTKTPLDPKLPVVLNADDKIKFGIMDNVWTVYKVLFVTCTSTIKGENLSEIQKEIVAIGGNIVNDWEESVTHLTMPAIQMTIKVLQALAFARPIVRPDFWRACRQAVTDNQPLPDPLKYLPPVIEAALDADNISFTPDESRQTIFAGKKFIFFSRKQMNMYKSVLLQCSASVALLSECRITKAKLCADDVVVVQFSPAMTSQDTQSQQQVIGDLVSYLNNKSRRVVPDLEISLAVLYRSTEKYCNPKLNIPMQILNACNARTEEVKPTSNILAPETQDIGEKKSNKPNVVIDQSLVSLRNESAEDSLVLPCPTSSGTIERTKRKINNDHNSNEHSKKRPTLNNTSLCGNEDSMFDFQEENPKTAAAAPIKPAEKKLSFMKVRNRKNENDKLEENIFDFLPDKKDTEKISPGVSAEKQGLFQNNNRKRKQDNNDFPHPKKPHIQSPPAPSVSMSDVKADISELLKNSFWKSCSDELAKREIIIKEELDESVNSKTDVGITVVTIKNDLIKKETSSLIQGNISACTGTNFKKFKKVMPLHVQVTVMPSSMVSIYRPEPNVESNGDGCSSEEEPEIWIPNQKKGRQGSVR